jgi:Ca2+-binding RTX toxin-like protein
LVGFQEADLIWALPGDDTLLGNGGNDRLRGGQGSDRHEGDD